MKIPNLLKPTSVQELLLPSGNSVEVATAFLTFPLWRGETIEDTYGGKVIVDYEGEPVFAELAILRIFQSEGWQGVWVDTFRNKYRINYWQDKMGVELPPEQKRQLKIIAEKCQSQCGCFDVFCWKDGEVIFVESKRKSRDKVRATQLRWLEAALDFGIPLESFLIVEWSVVDETLGRLTVERKTGDERFHINNEQTSFALLNFWQWAFSDLCSNTLRGALAEYIVACALHSPLETRIEWNAYDLETDSGIKVEVKSAAYLQSWTQNQISAIGFDIRPTYGWDAITNTFSQKKMRQADVYVFCILSHKEKQTFDPLNLSQWEFYVLPSRILDREKPTQKTISLSSLLSLAPQKADFKNLAKTVELCVNENH